MAVGCRRERFKHVLLKRFLRLRPFPTIMEVLKRNCRRQEPLCHGQTHLTGRSLFPRPARNTASPLTLLVGENSTGKSTVLAAARLAWDISNGVASPDFNEEPFDWGAYDQIACVRGGRNKAKSFLIGCESDNGKIQVESRFEERDSQPWSSKWHVSDGKNSIRIERLNDVDVKIIIENGRRSSQHQRGQVLPGDYRSLASNAIAEDKEITEHEKQHLYKLVSRYILEPRPYAFAPIRTRPKRTYDRRADIPGPEGETYSHGFGKTQCREVSGVGRIKGRIVKFRK